MRPEVKKAQSFVLANTDGLKVYAPLPEKYGFGINNEISAPFGVYALAGELSKLFALYGRDASAGLTTTKFWTGMEQPDISVDLSFRTYQSSRDDVMAPVLTLALMSSGLFNNTLGAVPLPGTKTSIEDAVADVLNIGGDIINTATDIVGIGDIVPKLNQQNITHFFRFTQGPALCSAYFGNVFTLQNLYVSSFNVEFSNQLDFENYPMSADVSLTLTLQTPLDKKGLFTTFGVPRGRSGPPVDKLARLPGK